MSQENYDALVKLADTAGFPEANFSEAEKKLFGSVAFGTEVNCGEDVESERKIRSGLFEWLFSDRHTSLSLHHRGLRIENAHFEERIDLSFASVSVPLLFLSCEFDEGLNFESAAIKQLEIISSIVNSTTEGAICLELAKIDGLLNLENTKLRSNQNALGGDGIFVRGFVLLRRGFAAEGKISLLGAEIGGDLDMSDATLQGILQGNFRTALNAGDAEIGGNVLLRTGFSSQGVVSLLGSRIHGDLEMIGANLEHSSGTALFVGRASIGGDVFLSDDFICQGDVEFPGTRVEGSLKFVSQGPGQAGIDPSAQIIGTVYLRGATVGTLVDDERVWRIAENNESGAVPALDGFIYRALGRHSPKNANFRKKWLSAGKHTGGKFAPQPYTQLAKVLRESGHPLWATKILVEREKRQLRELDDTRIRKWIRWFFIEILLGHGYRPWRLVIPMLLFLCLGWGVFWCGWKREAFNPTTPLVYAGFRAVETTEASPAGSLEEEQRFPPPYKDLSQTRLKQYPEFVPFVYSLDTLLPIVNLHQETFWMPTGWFRFYLWIHIALGWVMTTLFVTGIAGVVRRPSE